MQSCSSHLPPTDSPQTPARCPTVCTPRVQRKLSWHPTRLCGYIVQRLCRALPRITWYKYWPQRDSNYTQTANQINQWRSQSGRERRCERRTGSRSSALEPNSAESNTYLDDPLSVLPSVVVLCILAENVCDELEFLRGVIQPLDHHTSVMPGAEGSLESRPYLPTFSLNLSRFRNVPLPLSSLCALDKFT